MVFRPLLSNFNELFSNKQLNKLSHKVTDVERNFLIQCVSTAVRVDLITLLGKLQTDISLLFRFPDLRHAGLSYSRGGDCIVGARIMKLSERVV